MNFKRLLTSSLLGLVIAPAATFVLAQDAYPVNRVTLVTHSSTCH